MTIISTYVGIYQNFSLQGLPIYLYQSWDFWYGKYGLKNHLANLLHSTAM
jgi:hypothetical protein